VPRAFAQRELAPHAAELDRHPRFPWPTLRKMGEMGLLGVMTPEEHGGLGLGQLALAVLLEEVAAADASHAGDRVGHQRHAAVAAARARQRRPEGALARRSSRPARGSARSASPNRTPAATRPRCDPRRAGRRRLRARRHQGVDHLGGEAQLYLVLAKTDPRPAPAASAPSSSRRGRRGDVVRPPERKLGQHAAVTTSVRFDDAFVPEDQRLGAEGQGS
jgi:alkylation response protein AidB-like acyl-CoA dehydrogenase